EWLAGKLALIKLDGNQANKEEHRSDILNRAAAWDRGLRGEALIELFRTLPDDEALKKIARGELANPDSATAVQALQYQTAFDREWLKESFSDLPPRNDYLYQLVTIDFLAAHCPRGWQEAAEALRARPAGPDITKHLDDARLGIKCRLGL